MGRLKPVRWRRVAMQYGCTTCGAPPGQPCVTTADVVKAEVHVARSNLASADAWVLHEEERPMIEGLMHVCPDCVAGKHGNCTNEAWDPVHDEPVPCDCHARNHEVG